MACRIFLDVDVLLDFLLKGEEYDRTRKLMKWTVNGKIQAFVTVSVLKEIGQRLRQAYGPAIAKDLQLALLAEISVIDAGHTVAVSALHSPMGDREEALNYYTALHHKLDYFISNNKELPSAAVPTLPVNTPEEFLQNNQ